MLTAHMAGHAGGVEYGPVECRSGDAEKNCNLGSGDIRASQQSADCFDLFGRKLCGAASLTAANAGRLETSDSPFADQIALKFGECGEDMED